MNYQFFHFVDLRYLHLKMIDYEFDPHSKHLLFGDANLHFYFQKLDSNVEVSKAFYHHLV